MKEINVIWRKTGHAYIRKQILLCDCSTKVDFIGSAGCEHGNCWTYTYQCPSCKKIFMTNKDYKEDINLDSYYERNGWKMEFE